MRNTICATPGCGKECKNLFCTDCNKQPHACGVDGCSNLARAREQYCVLHETRTIRVKPGETTRKDYFKKASVPCRLAEKPCAQCGKFFKPIARRDPFCSAQCYAESYTVKGDQNDCWIWTGPATDKGYTIAAYHNKMVSAQRFVAKLVGEPVTDRIYHHCKNSRCVNPSHFKTTAKT